MTDYEQIVQAIKEGRNVFITGSAGTGKSYILNQLKEEFPHMAVTASTGAAAVNVGGTTIHSFSGIGIGDTPAHILMEKLRFSPKIMDIKGVELLAIDEISMLNHRLMDLINEFFKMVRMNQDPFGGVQLIVIGDFLQLPPVQGKPGEDFCDFAFESDAWREAGFKSFILTKVYRQEDEEFLSVLNRARYGEVSEEDSKFLTNNVSNDEDVVHLYARNKAADNFNAKKLNAIDSKLYCYMAEDTGQQKYLSMIDRYCLAPSHLYLKKGARVMLIVNKSVVNGLINGATGTVTDLNHENVSVHFDNGFNLDFGYEKLYPIKYKGEEVASRTQVPLRLAWAISIHKSQGMTLEKVKVDAQGVFEYGQAYVALSRAKSVNGLYLRNFDRSRVKAHPKAIEFVNNLLAKGNQSNADNRDT